VRRKLKCWRLLTCSRLVSRRLDSNRVGRVEREQPCDAALLQPQLHDDAVAEDVRTAAIALVVSVTAHAAAGAAAGSPPSRG
jgi:hypothetical protein